MLVFLATYGCQANERDSETILGMLAQMGYQETTEEGDADLILLNTCSIREKASQKAFSYLGTLRKYKEGKPGLVIGVCGCMAQEEGMVEALRRRAPFVDIVLGTHRLHRLPELIRNVQGGLGFQSDQEESGEVVEMLPSIRPLPFKALIHITFGCDNFCSYCIVPYVRGRERSRKTADIIAECRQRVDEGALELMFLGQNVNAFGKTPRAATAFTRAETMLAQTTGFTQAAGVGTGFGAAESFANLLYEAQGIGGLERIRFLSSHPRDFGDDLIQAIAHCPKVARHIHLPMQSGSDRVLLAMNRGYTREGYLDLVGRIRAQIPETTLTTDVIAGFPGERDEDLQDTLDMLRRVRFSAAFTFMFSPRDGTPAAGMDGQIPFEEKKSRLQAVMDVQAENSRQYHQSLLGQELEVLAESWADGRLSGRGGGHQLIYFPGDVVGVGSFHRVKVSEARTWTLVGQELDVAGRP